MSDKLCPICDEPFKDDEDIVAIMLSKFRAIESSVHYAIKQPTTCIEIVHSGCFDWEDYEDSPRGEIT